MLNTLINGEFCEHVNILDRGLHYGDGIFTTIAIHNAKLLCWQQHLARLLSACQQLKIEPVDAECLYTEAKLLTKDVSQGVLKIMITRGCGGRGYAIPKTQSPQRMMIYYPAPTYPQHYYQQGVKLRLCNVRYFIPPDHHRVHGLKHLNRLEQVMARSEWQDDEIAEGIILDQEAHIIEGTMSNIAYIGHNKLVICDTKGYGVDGIIRSLLISLAQELSTASSGLIDEVVIKKTTMADLYQADEVLLCNSIMGVLAVKQIDDQMIKCGKQVSQIRKYLTDNHYIANYQ